MSEHTPWHVFEQQGPIDSRSALALATHFESRTIYRDDFRWIVDSLIAARAERDAALRERDAARALLDPWRQAAKDYAAKVAESAALANRLEEAEALVRRLLWDGTLHGDDLWQARAKVLKDAAAWLAASGPKEGNR